MSLAALLVTGILMVVSLVGPPCRPADASSPGRGTWFKYYYHQWVDETQGGYQGYTEETKGNGRYEIMSWGPTEVTVRCEREWHYSSSEGTYDSGHYIADFSFSLADRTYTSARIDLDDPEYVSQPPNQLGQWLWIPTSVSVGDKIHILDSYWTVHSKDAVLWKDGVPRKLIEVQHTGRSYRDDAYGTFGYKYVDNLYFDQRTGMFWAERYQEWDTGTYRGLSSHFRYNIDIDVTTASYTAEVDWLTALACYSLIPLFLTLFFYGCYRIRWRSRKMFVGKPPAARPPQVGGPPQVGQGYTEYSGIIPPPVTTGPSSTSTLSAGFRTQVQIRRIWKPKQFPHIENNATEHFGAFLPHFVDKAFIAKDRVAVAVTQEKGLVGVAFYNKEARIGTVLCRDTDLTEALRSFIGCKDFFSEYRHSIDTRDMEQSAQVTPPQPGAPVLATGSMTKELYNIFETSKVYRLPSIPFVTYDKSLVRPMKEEDLPAVAALAKKIDKARASRWMAACFAAGDLAYVAEAGGRIVGYGFACVCDGHGRLHTLGVDPDFRGRGIAKQLHRARLKAMAAMGVMDVIDEIGDWNLASIRISTLSGFKPVGKMYVETMRPTRVDKVIVRRW